ncbi:hypothetical protein AVEN_63171-1 [Araneus ventricosus]|uniref:Uncharacterized protein n=1 Tax=Araneus ventricosus TaxID=182803 RepID=A0A4Y2B125_ARAVE|nr:hypothetical protein AVEN_63171-1 [Araneus ventricosus]
MAACGSTNVEVKIMDPASPEYVFAAQLVEHVMQRKFIFQLDERFRVRQDMRLFPEKTRRYVGYFLNKFSLELYFGFAKCFESKAIHNFNFEQFVAKLKETSRSVRSKGDLLRFATCLSYYAELAVIRGACNAPYISLRCIYDVVVEYINSGKQGASNFLNDMEEASKELLEDFIIDKKFIF